jgi:hypothetical protein
MVTTQGGRTILWQCWVLHYSYTNSLCGEVCEGDVVVANGPQARQDLRERRDNEVLGMPAKKFL